VSDAVIESMSLRERKKARTRAALIEVSQRRFEEQGYAATTLDDICAEVEVTPQTLLRYFESKAHLALAPMLDEADALRAFLEAPDRALPALDLWREFLVIESTEVTDPTTPTTASHVANLRAFQRWGEQDPVLVAMANDVQRQLRDMLAAALIRDWGADEHDLHAMVVAGALVSGRWAVWLRWLSADEPSGSLLDEQLVVVAYVRRRLPRSTADQLHPPI
jgi:AcrR family transcriptional regulator